jgi:hypothetical protein
LLNSAQENAAVITSSYPGGILTAYASLRLRTAWKKTMRSLNFGTSPASCSLHMRLFTRVKNATTTTDLSGLQVVLVPIPLWYQKSTATRTRPPSAGVSKTANAWPALSGQSAQMPSTLSK